MFRIALEWPDENFDNFFEEAIPLWKMDLSTGVYMLTFHVLCLLQLLRTSCSVMFSNTKDVDSFKGCM